MKKLLLIFAAFITVVGCSKTEIITADAEVNEIGLHAINQKSVKATGPVVDTALPIGETMTIWGFYANDGTNYVLNDPYMSGVIYKYQTDAWQGWDPNATPAAHKPYYWPSTGSMKFLAVYPTAYPKEEGGTISYANASNPTITISKIDLSTFGNQKDIMYSSNLYETPVACSNATSKQTLTFEHLLSQVVVAVKPTVTNVITITEVSLTNVYLKGDIAVTHEGSTITYSYPNTTTPILGYPLVAALENTAITNTDSFTQVSEKGALVIPSNNDTRKLII
ncbi:MAG: fimbrillin family protein, partial [Bacteroidia bacterium]|nr:fimbrillin family protein [Bacteroidia bacterium]